VALTTFENRLPKHYWVRANQKRNNAKVSVLREQNLDGGLNHEIAYVQSSEQGYEAFVKLEYREWCLGAFFDPQGAEDQIVDYWIQRIAQQVIARMEE